jgi:hypothetical protein
MRCKSRDCSSAVTIGALFLARSAGANLGPWAFGTRLPEGGPIGPNYVLHNTLSIYRRNRRVAMNQHLWRRLLSPWPLHGMERIDV